MKKFHETTFNRPGRGIILAAVMHISVLSILLTGCSNEQIEEFTFRKTIINELTNLCGNDAPCVKAVEEQVQGCMVSSNWREYLDSDSQEAMDRFTKKFYACIVDSEGNPYFELKEDS